MMSTRDDDAQNSRSFFCLLRARLARDQTRASHTAARARAVDKTISPGGGRAEG